MDCWDTPVQDHRYRHRKEPSFSSTLLDAIYRSIDEGEERVLFCTETMRKKHSRGGDVDTKEGEEDLARWMQKKAKEKAHRRKSMADLDLKSRINDEAMSLNSGLSLSSSLSSRYGGGLSSSESESIYATKSRSTYYSKQMPNPIRSNLSERREKPQVDAFERHQFHHQSSHVPQQKQKRENGFVKTKSKALKIYGDLKKVKQPLSPGNRLASFLNSLFALKKAKASSPSVGSYESKSGYTSTCSSTSSFSKSCLSKNPPSSNNGTKRSVRFCPVSVAVNEACQPCGEKGLYGDLKLHAMEDNTRVEEAARDLLKKYQKKDDLDAGIIQHHNIGDSEDEDDDDAASYSSSDLFELDSLSASGIQRYREELPVYETTHLDTNRAIANGLIV